jgi:hypothetical protein
MKALLIRLAKALLSLAMDETLRRGLPKIYRQLDRQVPITLTSRAVEQEFITAISNATQGKVSREAIEIVSLLYNPIKAAISNK